MEKTKKTVKISTTVDEETLTKIEEYRRKQDKIPSRAEALRTLIRKGLEK
jgi:metal-responsive CopG/Arc/MetJ family transcriptional regulator